MNMVQQVIMSKKVAARYLAEVSKTGKTLTVYFSNDSSKNSFLHTVKTSSQASAISISEGFDYATFISTDKKAMEVVEDLVEDLDLDWNDY